MTDLLPIGAYVRVTPFPIMNQSPYTGIVRGYDLHRSKYRIGYEFLPGQFTEGGWWAFPAEVEASSEVPDA